MNIETDRWVRSDDARRRLRDLLDEVDSAGEHIYVLRYDKPAAVIVPVQWYEAIRELMGGDAISPKSGWASGAPTERES